MIIGPNHQQASSAPANACYTDTSVRTVCKCRILSAWSSIVGFLVASSADSLPMRSSNCQQPSTTMKTASAMWHRQSNLQSQWLAAPVFQQFVQLRKEEECLNAQRKASSLSSDKTGDFIRSPLHVTSDLLTASDSPSWTENACISEATSGQRFWTLPWCNVPSGPQRPRLPSRFLTVWQKAAPLMMSRASLFSPRSTRICFLYYLFAMVSLKPQHWEPGSDGFN